MTLTSSPPRPPHSVLLPRAGSMLREDPLRLATLVALVFAVLLVPFCADRAPGVNLRLSLVATGLPLGLALLRAIALRRLVLTPPLTAAILLLLSAVAALPADPAPTGTTVVLTYALAVGCAWAVVQVCEPRDVGRLLEAFTITCGVVAVIALSAQSAPVSSQAGGTVITGRLTEPFSQPNELGEFGALALPISLAAAWYAPTRPRRLLYLGCAAGNVVALAMSFSRGGWMAAGAALIVLGVLLPPIRALVVGGIAATAGFAGLVLAAPDAFGGAFAVFHTRLLSLADGSDGPYDRRPEYWAEALQVADRYPFFGIGSDGFMWDTSQVWSGVGTEWAHHAHSITLTVLAEQGTFGLMALFLIFVTLIAAAIRLAVANRRTPEARNSTPYWTSAATIAAMTATAVHGLTDMPLHNPIVLAAVSLVFGCACVGLDTPGVRRRHTSTPFAARRTRLVAAAAVAAAGAIGWVGYVVTLPTSYIATSIITLRSKTAVPLNQVLLISYADEYSMFLSTPTHTAEVVQPFAGASAAAIPMPIDPIISVIRINATAADPPTAVGAANAVADLGVRRGAIDPQVQVLVTAHADAEQVAKTPKRSLYLAAGLGVPAALVGIAVYYRRRIS